MVAETQFRLWLKLRVGKRQPANYTTYPGSRRRVFRCTVPARKGGAGVWPGTKGTVCMDAGFL